MSFPVELYTGIITLVALCKVVFGARWASAVVVLNVLALAGVSVLVARLSWRLTRSRGATLFSFALLLPCFEMWNWARLVLSDPTFLFVSTLLLGLECLLLLPARPERSQEGVQVLAGPMLWVASALLLLVATFYRPTGVLLWLPFGLAVWMCLRRSRGRAMSPRPSSALAVAGVLSLAAIVGHSALMEKPERWPLHAFQATLQGNAEHYRMGEVIWDRRETWHPAPRRTSDFVLIALDRWRYFWAPLYGGFSRGHNALNALFFGPAYGFALASLFSLARSRGSRGSPWSDEERACLWLAWAWLWEVSLFHALVQVDYDWRYRLPVLPPLMVLAAVGFAWAQRRQR